ncbi:MAG TPA: SDR family oxidoreductase [Longimicrobiales bacterium]|nr:SDR family oxidoreductase [Longimicrobiales bacterium]
MSDRRAQRVALVTGGALRLGRHLARGLAAAGWDVAISYRSSADAAREAAGEVRALGRRCEALEADLADPAAPEALVGAVGEAFGRLDLLVSSAASFDARPLLEVDAEAWDAVMDVNVRAPHLLVRAAAPLLREARGSVVNLADLAAFQAWTEHPHHAVSKAALVHLTRVQARALAPEVRVNAVAPGAVLPPDDWPESRLEALARAAPLRRLGTPEDVVQAVLYLADALYVTGHVLVVDGGRLLRG